MPKPQSVPAMTFSRPTISANLMIRSATSSGCSTKFVVVSKMPGMRTFPSGRRMSFQTFHSCSCRGLAASNTSPVGLASSTMSMMLASGMSVMCGHSPFPQHTCIRICSGGMSRRAWLSARTCIRI